MGRAKQHLSRWITLTTGRNYTGENLSNAADLQMTFVTWHFRLDDA